MNRRKAKYRSDAPLTEARQTGVRMRREEYTAKAIAAVLEVHPTTVYRWESRVQEAADAALRVLKRGRKIGEKRHLSPPQERELQQRICQKQRLRRWGCRSRCGPAGRCKP